MKRAFAGLLAAGAVAAAAAAASAPALAVPALPDGRAYELVSPLESRGVDYDFGWTTPDGDHAILTSTNDILGVRLATRTPEGWSVRRTEPLPPGTNVEYIPGVDDATDDLARLVVEAAAPGQFVRDRLFAYDVADDAWSPVGTGVTYAGGSADLGTVVVVPSGADDPYPELDSGSGVFAWRDGEVASVGDDDWVANLCGATVADGSGLRSNEQSGVSADGGIVVLTNRQCTDPDTSETLLPHVLVSIDGETWDLSMPVEGAPDAAAAYVGNSVDGSVIFLETAGRLVPGDVNGVRDLYRVDLAEDTIALVSGIATADGAALVNAISSDDGSGAWFVTQLAGSQQALWSWQEGRRPRLVSVAANGGFGLNTLASAGHTQTQISVDGGVLAWLSSARIGGSRGPSAQLMRATAAGDVDCLSCRPDGSGTDVSLGNPPDRFQLGQQRMSDDGEQLFWQSSARLVPEDQNGAVDTYGWSDGVVSLISSGTEARASELQGVSRRGDVFFKEGAALLPWIEDDHVKIYTARADGGFPAPASPLPGCTGDDCQGAVTPPPATPSPGSEADHGPGDADAPERPWAADPAVTVGKLGAKAKRRLAQGRAIPLPVSASARGRVTATVTYRAGGRWVAAGSSARTVKRAGRTTLTVRLGKRARATLARRGSLRVRIEVAHAAGVRDARTTFVLKTRAGRGR